MAVQSVYLQNHVPFHLGSVADGVLFDSVTGLTGSEAIDYGKGVIRDGNKIKLATSESEAQKFLGVVMYEKNRALESADEGKVPANNDATIVTRGDIAVKATTSTAIGDPVYFVHGESGRGDFAGGNTAPAESQILDSWEWKTTTAANGIGVIGVKSNVVLPVASE